MKNRVEIPTINEKYNFYDDGKVSFGRHSIVEVKRILTIEDAKQLQIKYYETNEIKSLYDIFMHQEAVTFSYGCNLYDPASTSRQARIKSNDSMRSIPQAGEKCKFYRSTMYDRGGAM